MALSDHLTCRTLGVSIASMEVRPIPSAGVSAYQEFLRSRDLSVGVYRLDVGAVDSQQPHTEDEVYHVLAGRATFTADGETVEVAAGMCLFVPALQQHGFHHITEALEVLVVFGPAEGSRS
jgi:mannose-6-phosphate isomerase-like protein (cupin superfamily)